MPVYSAARLAVSGTVESIEDAAGAQLRVTSLAFASEDADANAVSGQDVRLTRCTISAGSTIVKDQDSTRSRASSAIARSGPTAVKSGSALVCIGGETHTTQFLWRPPRPWACPIATDAGASDGFVWEGHSRLQSKILQFDDDAFGRDLARPSRRPRRAGYWHYRSEKTVRQLSKNTFYRVGANWVAPVDTRAYRTRPVFPQQTSSTTPVSNSAVMWLEAAQGVAATAVDPVEATQGIAGTATSLPLEATQGIVQVGGAGPVEVAGAVATTAQDPVEAAGGVAGTASDPVESIQALAGQQATTPVEALGGVAPATEASPVEAAGGISTVAALVVEALGGIAQTAADWIEAARGVVTSALDAIESALGLSTSSPGPVEAAGGIASTGQEPVEALGGVAATASDPIESTQVGVTPVSQTGTLALEALGGIAATTQDPVDVTGGVASPATAPVESVQPISTQATEPLESAAGVAAQTASLPIDVLGGLLAGDVFPLEALGFLPIPAPDDGGAHGGSGFPAGWRAPRRIDDDEEILVVLDLLDLL